jgi:3-dehydroquinate dehydratase II
MSKVGRRRSLRSKTPPKRILVLHGPNLNMLGTREPAIYGSESLQSINERLTSLAKGEGITLEAFQSNQEGALIERVHAAKTQRISWIIVNPGGLTHTRVGCNPVHRSASLEYLLKGAVPAAFVLFRPCGGHHLRLG